MLGRGNLWFFVHEFAPTAEVLPPVVDEPVINETDPAPGESLSAARRLRLVLVLGFLSALGPMTIDMSLPSLPTIAGDLHAGAAAVQLTLTGTLVGLGLGQLLVGPLSDAVGRRAPLLAGVAVHV